MFWTRTTPVPNQLMLPFPFQVVQQVAASKQAKERKKKLWEGESGEECICNSLNHTHSKQKKRYDMTLKEYSLPPTMGCNQMTVVDFLDFDKNDEKKSTLQKLIDKGRGKEYHNEEQESSRLMIKASAI